MTQGPSRTCKESEEEEEGVLHCVGLAIEVYRGATPCVELRRVAAGLRRGLAAPADSDPLFREGMGVAIMAKPL